MEGERSVPIGWLPEYRLALVKVNYERQANGMESYEMGGDWGGGRGGWSL